MKRILLTALLFCTISSAGRAQTADSLLLGTVQSNGMISLEYSSQEILSAVNSVYVGLGTDSVEITEYAVLYLDSLDFYVLECYGTYLDNPIHASFILKFNVDDPGTGSGTLWVNTLRDYGDCYIECTACQHCTAIYWHDVVTGDGLVTGCYCDVHGGGPCQTGLELCIMDIFAVPAHEMQNKLIDGMRWI